MKVEVIESSPFCFARRGRVGMRIAESGWSSEHESCGEWAERWVGQSVGLEGVGLGGAAVALVRGVEGCII